MTKQKHDKSQKPTQDYKYHSEFKKESKTYDLKFFNSSHPIAVNQIQTVEVVNGDKKDGIVDCLTALLSCFKK